MYLHVIKLKHNLFVIFSKLGFQICEPLSLCVLEHKMNYDMNFIQSWLWANELTLNVMKTKYILEESI